MPTWGGVTLTSRRPDKSRRGKAAAGRYGTSILDADEGGESPISSDCELGWTASDPYVLADSAPSVVDRAKDCSHNNGERSFHALPGSEDGPVGVRLEVGIALSGLEALMAEEVLDLVERLPSHADRPTR